ncbi:helix-turn-helix domain-containing protein [Paenibacillus koleovorans]|uniref:helix-turn-helix domain-containing protein n=1 Tax=Paenibacillus koleovorans TaxID=121608 RepID=UPI000FDBEE41|nr:helix-turn-helix transcriptional regulator [Paenibacillus koleovorans]
MEQEKAGILAERLRETREYLGLSQQFVADYIGISRAAISSIESGKRKVDALELEKFSKLYKYPITYFYGNDEKEDEKTVQLLARTASQLDETDRKQVLKFAQFLKNVGKQDN